MKARVDAAKYLVYAAAQKKQAAMDGAKVRYSVEAAEAKLIAARTASDVTRRCLQLFGGCLLYTSPIVPAPITPTFIVVTSNL